MHARKHGGKREIRIGIGTGDAVLDATRISRADRNAQSSRAIVHAQRRLTGANISGWKRR